MIISLYVNGMSVDTYKCRAATMADLTPEDQEALDVLKCNAYRNFGYPPVLVAEPNKQED